MRVLTSPAPAKSYVSGVDDYVDFIRNYSKTLGPFDVFLLGSNLLPLRTHDLIRQMWIDGLTAGCRYHLFWMLDDVELHELFTVTQQTFDLARNLPGHAKGQIHHYATWLNAESKDDDYGTEGQYTARIAAVEADAILNGRIVMHSPKRIENSSLRKQLNGFWQKFCSLGVHVPNSKSLSPYSTVYLPAMKVTPESEPKPCFGFLDMNGTGRELQITLERMAKTLID